MTTCTTSSEFGLAPKLELIDKLYEYLMSDVYLKNHLENRGMFMALVKFIVNILITISD